MKVLLLAHRVYTEHANGAARSVRTILEWLSDAGHECRVLATGRFGQSPGLTIGEHHDSLGLADRREAAEGKRPVVRYQLRGVMVTVIETEHPTPADIDELGDAQLGAAITATLQAWRPDLVLAYGGEPVIHAGLAAARQAGARTIFTVRSWGYEHRNFFLHADRALMTSRHSAEFYARAIGLRGDGLPSPILWPEIEATAAAREFVTFINPTPYKGVALFARLADMLGRARPDIPMLVVESGASAAALAGIPELDLARHPQILVSPARADPREIYAVTRILLVPSVFAEPFGRVAAEAMINAIPPLVSDRGGLPETVGSGGIVLPVPPWLTPSERRVPSEAEMQPWFDAVVRLWDDPAAYARASAAARQTAEALYGEDRQRQRYLDYFTDPGPFPPLFPEEQHISD